MDYLKAADGYIYLTTAFVRTVKHLEHPVRLDNRTPSVSLGAHAAASYRAEGQDKYSHFFGPTKHLQGYYAATHWDVFKNSHKRWVNSHFLSQNQSKMHKQVRKE